MKTLFKIALIFFLPISLFSQDTDIEAMETSEPDIYEFSRETSLLQSFTSFIQIEDLDPRIKYMYQSTPFQQSINMTKIALQKNNSDKWYKYNENPDSFAQRQQDQINDAVKTFSQDDDKKIQIKVEEVYRNPQFSRFNLYNSSPLRSNFYYRQRNLRVKIDLSDD